MQIICNNSGRLGNTIFRMFAAIIFCIIYNTKILENEIELCNNNIIPINDIYFNNWLNDFYNDKIQEVDKNLTYFFNGYYQHDKIYVKYKNEIINYINNNNLILKTHFNEYYKAIDLINYDLDTKYDIVVHLRLEDFIDISMKQPFVMNPIYIKNIIKKLNIKYPDQNICLVLNKPKYDLEFKYINYLKIKCKNIVVESNDPIKDFNIMKNAKILVCSMSTLSWTASFLSNTLEELYFPDYQNPQIHETFKKPIENTILYEFTKCTVSELEQILDFTLNSALIISGEKIQEKCDIYLANTFNEYNPKTRNHINKHIYYNNITSNYDNPKIIFTYTFNISILSTVIDNFMNDFILVTHNCDENIIESDTVIKILNCNKLQKWYTQNLAYDHEKLFLLPIGFANSEWLHGNLSIFNHSNIMNNLQKKYKKIYFNFSISTNKDKRQICYDSLKDKLEWLSNINPTDNLYRLRDYEFCICPEGNGFDTHRLWEALYLKVVPIVINSDFSKILVKNNLPILVLENWNDLNNLDINNLNYLDYNFDIIREKFTIDTIFTTI